MSLHIRAAFGLAIAGFLVVAGTAQAQTVLRFNQNLPANHWANTDIIVPWSQRVAEATQGRVRVQMTGSSLGGFAQSMDIAAEGVADLSFGNYGVLGGRFTLAKITENALLGSSDPLPVSVAFWRAYERHFARAREHEQAGVRLMAHWVSGANHFYTRERALRVPADLRGLKFATSTPVVDRIIGQFGGQGLAAPSEQLYDLVARGVVDGAILANTGPNASRTEGQYRYQLMIPGSLFFSGFYIVMNQRRWEALPEAERDAIARVSGEPLVRLAGEVFSRRDRADLDARRAAGRTQVTEADAAFLEALRVAARSVEDEWVASAQRLGFDGAAALRDLRQEAQALDRGS